MKRKLRLVALLASFFLTVSTYGQIISQYIETNSGTTPKGIEIWNNTGATLDFSINSLVIEKGNNGGVPAPDYTLNAGTLAEGAVIVIGTSDMQTVTEANGAVYYEKGFSFNGDDALVVKYGGTITDVFGTPETDPGSEWAGNGVSTKNQNIQLLPGITTGNIIGWDDPSTRFETVSTDPVGPGGLVGFGLAPEQGGGTPQAATPTFTPGTGTYFTAQDVVIESATPGATIYYTTNGDEPDNTSTEYSTAVNISTTTTLKAIAYATGFDPSNVGSATYTFETVNEVADIATLRAGATDGTLYKLTGEALLTFQTASRNQKYIQDATGAILIDDNNGVITTTYAIGDGIAGITGTLSAFQNMLQFVPTLDPGAPTSQGNVLTPVSVTLANLDDSYQAKLVKVSNATFTDAGNFASGQNYPITDPSGNGVIRTQYSDVDYIGEAIPTDPQNITGVILQYNSNMQLIPRSLSDFETVAAATPIVTVDPASLSGFTYEEGNGPSSSQSFTVEGSDLTADVSITPSANYEISQDDISFQTTAITLTETAGTVGTTVIYVRLKAGLATGDYNGEEITASSVGAADQVVTLSGSVSEAAIVEPLAQVTAFTATAISSDAISLSWTDSDANAYLIKASNVSYAAIVDPVDGIAEVDGALVKNIAAGIQSHTFTGLADNSSYFFKIFAYNGSDTEVNYKTDGTPEATAATEEAISGAVSDLIISEYSEGSSNNKYIEIYNGTGANVSLDNYQLWFISNGGSWPENTFNFEAGASIANGEVYIVSNNSANSAITDLANETSGSINFNGDDAVGIAKDMGGTFTLIDAVGEDGPDPGTGWDVAGITNATKDHTLVRKADVCDPTTNWALSAGTDAANSQWIVLEQDDWSFLGSHVNTCGSSNLPPTIANITQTPATDVMPDQTVSVSADVTDGDGTVASVVLNWGLTSGDLSNAITMNLAEGSTYATATAIPTQAGGLTVYYAITAEDDLGSTTTTAEQSYTVVLIDPTLVLDPTSLSGFEYALGEGPSAVQSYDISGFNFVGSGSVNVTAPASYEISVDNQFWFNSLILQYADGELIAQPRTMFVRMKAGLTSGDKNEAIAHEDINIGLVELPLSGEVTSITQVANIAALRQGATDGTVYQLTGEAIMSFAGSSRNQKFIQDATAGILIDDAAGKITTTYAIGDGITGLTGTISVYNNMVQFIPVEDPGAASSSGNTITPVEVTLNNLNASHQARLVKVNTVDFNTTGNFAQGTNYPVNDPTGSGVVRTQYSNLNYIGTPIPEVTQNITGVILQFNSTFQFIPRSLTDFEDAPITDPTIYADPMVVNGISYPIDAGPSNPQSFMISGINLTSGIALTTNSEYFEISATGGSNFVPTSPIIVNQTGGVVEETPIYVRLKAGLELGNYSSLLVANSAGAENLTITLNGSVYDGSATGGGLETFANLDLEGTSYSDGSFLGQDGSTWTFFQARGDYEITEKAIMLGRNRTPQANVFSGTIYGGVGTLNFDYMQAFGTGVNLNVLVNDIVVGNVTSSGEQNVIKNSGTITANIDGAVVIKFISVNNSDGQVVIDNVSWTAYEGGSPTAAAPVFDPPAGSYADPINVSLTSATGNADIYYSTTSQNGPWTAYSAAIAVSEATTIWAYASADGFENSPVVSAAYTFSDLVIVNSIAELRNGAADGTVYQLNSEAILTFQSSTRNQKFIQDATGAILIDDAPGIIGSYYNLYDGITGLTGTLSVYSNMIQFIPESDPGSASSVGNTLNPETVSLSQLNTTHQAKLITINFVEFTNGGIFASGTNYPITDPTGTGVIRTQYSDLDYIGEPIPETTQNITGVVLQFSSTLQFIPRMLADFEEANITDPYISVSPATLNGFTYEIGNGPSAEQSFTVSALNLTEDLSLDAPANYEMSLASGASFVAADPIELSPIDGTVAETSIYVRLKAGLVAGTYNGEMITASSDGATDKTVTLNGNVSDPAVGGGFETFANLEITGNSYVDGTFTGQDGSTWTFFQSRGDYEITDKAIMLGRNRTPQANVYSGVINGGIGTINFDYMQAFSTNVNLNILVNDVVVGNVTSNGEPDIVKNSGDIVVNMSGQVVIKFISNENNDGQVVIDNVAWTAYEGGTPVVLAPTFNPPAGNYFDPIDVTISSATPGATIYYSDASATGPWTEYSTPIAISEAATLWAYGELEGYDDSPVRSAAYTFGDIVPVATIAELRAGLADGTVYQLTGEAVLTFQSSTRNAKYIQDATAAILIDDNSGNITTTYNLYDGITGLTGTLTAYAGMIQFVPSSDPGVATSTGNTIVPAVVNLTDLDGTYQAKLVTVNMVDFVADGQFAATTNYDITDPGSTGKFRTHYADVDYIGTDIPVELQNITAVILQFNDDLQLVARSLEDFEDVNTTDPMITASPSTLNGFSYFVGEGPSASQSYTVSAQNLVGTGAISVAAPANYEISSDDINFGESLTLAFADGVITGQPVTVYARLKAGLEVGLYAGEHISHTGGDAPEALVTLNGEVTGEVVPAITAEIVPQYIQGQDGGNNNRLPYAYRLTISNLLPNATYRYINQAVVAGDDATTNGAGNIIFVNLSGDFLRSTSPSFSTEGGYGTFETNAGGSFSGWFITEATGNARFAPGNEVFMRVRLNDGNEGTTTETYLTTTNSATVINFGTENDATQGTAIRAISGDTPKSFALLYDNSRDGQPIAATSIETIGVDFVSISQYATFYKDEVAGNDGHWGTIIPNMNENGIQLIEIRDLVDGTVLKTYQAADGVWGTTNTVNPVGGLDEILVIDLIEIGLNEGFADMMKVYATQREFVIEKTGNEKVRLAVYNLMGQPMMQTELNGIGTQRLTHHLSSGVYILHLNSATGQTQAVKVIIR
ncbi:MAG: DUF5689 domain-containing protein [Bacteroidales bacterium]|jgi:hypothetical protein|nr:DUF5689 domain-containing protein [Bacteroidales bacterium]